MCACAFIDGLLFVFSFSHHFYYFCNVDFFTLFFILFVIFIYVCDILSAYNASFVFKYFETFFNICCLVIKFVLTCIVSS